MSTPSDLLSRAADLIRDTAAKWEEQNRRLGNKRAADWPSFCTPGGLYSWGQVTGFIVDEASDAALDAGEAWALLLNPAVAPALEALLRGFVPMALQVEAHGSFPGDSQSFARYHAALEFARVILGEVLTEDDS